MGLEVAEDFMVEVANAAEVTLAAVMDGEVVVTAGTVVVTGGEVVMAGEAAVHMAAGIGVVGTAVPIGMGAAGTGTEVTRIGGGIIPTVTTLLTTTTEGFASFRRFRAAGTLLNNVCAIRLSSKSRTALRSTIFHVSTS
jgi:hypothetical protein